MMARPLSFLKGETVASRELPDSLTPAQLLFPREREKGRERAVPLIYSTTSMRASRSLPLRAITSSPAAARLRRVRCLAFNDLA